MVKALTHKEFKKRITDKFGEDYTVLGEYKNQRTEMTIIHEKCGYKWNALPINFLMVKHGCPMCSKKMKKRDTKQYKLEVFNLVGDEYTVLGEYTLTTEKIKMKHNICGYVWYPFASSILVGHRCPYCNGGRRKSHREFKQELESLTNGEFLSITEYIAEYIDVEIYHTKCKKSFMARPGTFLRKNGQNCRHCSGTRGEVKISKFIEKSKMKFKKEYSFTDCVHINALRFDFVVFDDDKIVTLIEYDGEGHFRPVNFGGMSDKEAEVNFENAKIRDQIKNKYCEDNSIPLLRIPYWDFDNIESILTDYLSQFNLISK